jgi:hypothetical protein
MEEGRTWSATGIKKRWLHGWSMHRVCISNLELLIPVITTVDLSIPVNLDPEPV